MRLRFATAPGRSREKPEMHQELSWFLILYLLMILGVLLGIHLLQPASDDINSGRGALAHQQRQTALEKPIKVPTGARPEPAPSVAR